MNRFHNQSSLSLFAVAKIHHYHLNTNSIIHNIINKNEQAIPPAHPHHKGVHIYTTPISLFLTSSSPISDASGTTSHCVYQVHQSVEDVQAAAP